MTFTLGSTLACRWEQFLFRPQHWQEHADAWRQGFDSVPMDDGVKVKPVSDQMEAQVDEAAVDEPPVPND